MLSPPPPFIQSGTPACRMVQDKSSVNLIQKLPHTLHTFNTLLPSNKLSTPGIQEACFIHVCLLRNCSTVSDCEVIICLCWEEGERERSGERKAMRFLGFQHPCHSRFVCICLHVLLPKTSSVSPHLPTPPSVLVHSCSSHPCLSILVPSPLGLLSVSPLFPTLSPLALSPVCKLPSIPSHDC